MFIDPITGFRMKRAKAGGGSFWYGQHSRSRMLTVIAAKKFLGEDATREIWVRAGLENKFSEYKCPSCTKPMRLANPPKWVGDSEINVCRRCHIIWLKPDQHPVVPHPEDFITEKGDSTMLSDYAKVSAKYEMDKIKHDEIKKNLLGGGPELLRRKIFGFLALPTEMSEHG
ncbi:hypothetical protein N9W41_00805, partial [bacterium]|nr:hypothetical protein [bacterium]